MWLDGLIGTLTVGAFGGALVLPSIAAAAEGSTAAIVTNLAYPAADLLLIALLVGVFALCGWRPGRAWAFLAAGLCTLAVLDSAYLSMIATDTYQEGTVLDSGYLLAFLLLAMASWQRPRQHSLVLEGWAVLVVPAGFTLASTGLLLYDHFTQINGVAFLLLVGTLALSLIRTGLTFREVRALTGSRRMALTDELTGLGNRRALYQDVESALAVASHEGERLSVLLLDLDRLKQLNDTLGHRFGDRLLIKVAARLREAVPADAILSRLGGDEFAIVVFAVDDGPTAVRVAHDVRGALAPPFALDEMTVHIDGSLGVARYPKDADTVDGLLQRADVAMYQAKGLGTGVELYTAALGANDREDFELTGELRTAIADGRLVLHYQPQAAFSPATSPASKHLCDGITPSTACSHPNGSSRWPNRPASCLR